MPLVFGAIAPHGGIIVPQLTDDPAIAAQTRAAMIALGRRCAAARPDTVIVLDPHGLAVEGAFSVGATFQAAGIVGDPDGAHIKGVFDNDVAFVEDLFTAGVERFPMVRLVGEKESRKALLPLDFGALIPLWYTAHPLQPRPKIVVIAPDRSLPRESLVRFGVLLAQVARDSERRYALVASCDQGHGHDPDGPYGFDPASSEHDRLMCEAIIDNDFTRLLEWDEEFLEAAKVDAYWQTLILAGALGLVPMRGELLSYEAPTYFGMAVAAYEPDDHTTINGTTINDGGSEACG